MCHSMMGLTRCYKTAVFHILYLLFFDHNIITEVLPLPLQKTNERHMEILHPVSMQNFYRHFHVILQGRNKFCLNWTITKRVTTLCRFSIWRPYRCKYAFAFWFYDISPPGRQRSICVSNFHQISQSTTKLLLFMVAENKRPPYLNSTPGFDELFTVIGM